jgi:hypothetical protein
VQYSHDVLRFHRVFMQDIIVPSLMNKGIEFSVSSLSMVPGIPIKPMLAKYILFHTLALSVYYFVYWLFLECFMINCKVSGTLFSSRVLTLVNPFKMYFSFLLFVCRITNGIPQALKLFQNKAFTCEYKYVFFISYFPFIIFTLFIVLTYDIIVMGDMKI